MNDETYMVRQGDVLIRRVAEIPADARPVKAERLVLAEGEATGHAHVLEPVGAGEARLLRDGGRLLARILDGDARVVHEEHAPVILPPGDYEIVRQREYVPPASRTIAGRLTRPVID